MRLNYTFFLFLLFPILTTAQTYSVRGTIIDQEKQITLPGAHIKLSSMAQADKTTVSDERGNFTLKGLPNGDYQLIVSFLGFEDYTKNLSIDSQDIFLSKLTLISTATELEEVEVIEKTPPAVQLGDTTQFNSNAYKTNPDATAEDLIKKMPGIEVENGKVQAQGEEVKEVLVDGRPFFGKDPSAALRNLPAEVIQSIQVFDQKSDQSQFTGFEDGETTKAINIVTRPNMRNGQFGNIYAGYGYEDKYQAGGTINFFNQDQRISLIAQSNNLNIQNFSSEDLLGVVGNSGGGRRRGRGRGNQGGSNSVNDFLVNQSGGISKTHAFGLNYNDKWGEKAEFNGSYFFNQSENIANTLLNRQYIDGASISQVYDETSLNKSNNTNHRMSGRINLKFNDQHSIIIRPNLSVQLNDGSAQTDAQTLDQGTSINATDNQYQSDLSGANLSNSLLWRYRMKKPRRTLSLNLQTTYKSDDGESLLYSLNDFLIRGNLSSDTLNQEAQLDVKGWTYQSNLSYTEPVGKSGMLSFTLGSSYQTDESDKEVFDFSENSQAFDLFNSNLSNVFSNKYLTQRAGISYNIRKGRKSNLMFRTTFQWAHLKNEQEFPLLANTKQNFYNLLPMAVYRHRISRQKNLRISYRSRTNLPSISQLQNVVDNSNPLQLAVGNPSLEQSNQHSLFLRYNATNPDKSTVFYLRFGGEYGFKYIANATYLANSDHPIFADPAIQEGAQVSQPVNLDGYLSLRSFVTYGFPLNFLKSNLNSTFSLSHTRTPGLINDELNYSNNTATGIRWVLSSNISKNLDFTISSKSNINFLTYSLQGQENNNSFNQNSSINLTWIFWKGLVFRSNFSHQYYGGLSEEVDDNYLLWNMELGKKIFKNQRGELKLSVFDLLQQNTSINRITTDVYFEDQETDVLQRYFMLSFVYQLRHFGQAKKEENNKRRGRDWQW